MEFKNKTIVNKVRYNFTDYKDWFVKNKLYDRLVMFQVSADGSKIIKITFTTDLTNAEKVLILTEFPDLEQI